MATAPIVHKPLRPDVEIPDNVSLTDFVFGAGQPDDKVALIAGDASLTYGQVRGAINRAKHGLVKLGFKEGDIFALHLPNVPQFVIAFHAIAALGGVVTTSNPTYTASELEHQLKSVKARFLLTLPLFKDAAAAAAEAAGVEATFYLGEGPTFLDEANDEPCPSATFNPVEKLLVIPFSSGTSGLSKGVCLTHYNVVANLCQISRDSEHNLQIGPDDVVLGLLPLFHIYGMVVLCSAALVAGASVVFMTKFDPMVFLSLIPKHKITMLPIVPPIALFMAKHPAIDTVDLSSVKGILSGAAPLSDELTNQLSTRLGCPVSQGYGMTEAAPAITISMAPPVSGSCGRLIPNMEAKIVDPESGETKPVGTADDAGELWVRGPNVMKGYWNAPEATAATVDAEGWLHTGDIAFINDAGDMFITDRLKELIKTKGFQVAPAELEGLLLGNEKVADAAVIGVPDERAGEIPKAFVVLKPGMEATEDEIKEFISSKVTAYKRLGAVAFTDKIPKSASGKILRRVLRAAEASADKK